MARRPAADLEIRFTTSISRPRRESAISKYTLSSTLYILNKPESALLLAGISSPNCLGLALGVPCGGIIGGFTVVSLAAAAAAASARFFFFFFCGGCGPRR